MFDNISIFVKDSKLRSQAYVAIGKIGQRQPHLITKDLSLVQKLFDALSQVGLNINRCVCLCVTNWGNPNISSLLLKV